MSFDVLIQQLFAMFIPTLLPILEQVHAVLGWFLSIAGFFGA